LVSGAFVYRVFSAGMRLLRPKYHLTLLQIGRAKPADASLFDDVRILDTRYGVPEMQGLMANDFQLIYYPDVAWGMNRCI